MLLRRPDRNCLGGGGGGARVDAMTSMIDASVTGERVGGGEVMSPKHFFATRNHREWVCFPIQSSPAPRREEGGAKDSAMALSVADSLGIKAPFNSCNQQPTMLLEVLKRVCRHKKNDMIRKRYKAASTIRYTRSSHRTRRCEQDRNAPCRKRRRGPLPLFKTFCTRDLAYIDAYMGSYSG